MAKTTAVAVPKKNLPANWEEQMKADAAAGRQQEASVGVSRRLGTKGGVLTYQGQPMPGNKLEAVVLYASKENAYYEGEFDPSNPSSPVCFSFATQKEDEKAMVPHPDSEKKQHDNCKDCPKNKFGSAEKGRGKACKNQRHLILIHADSLKKKGGVDEAETVTASVPPTSLQGWAAYVKNLDSTTGKPPYAFVTELALQPRQEGGFTMTFAPMKEIDKKLMPDVFAKSRQAEQEAAERPPYMMNEAPAGKGKPAGRGARTEAPKTAPRRKF
jgi:hypothetical protein